MAKPDYRKVKEVAKRVLEENFVTAPPVRIDDIATRYGLKVMYGTLPPDLGNVAGYIMVSGPDAVVLVDSEEKPTRQNFTIAHELGHYLLHKEKLIDQPSIGVLERRPLGVLNNDPIEIEANRFASEVLVPDYLLKQYNGESVDTLARIFAVSTDVIGYRLTDLKNERRYSIW